MLEGGEVERLKPSVGQKMILHPHHVRLEQQANNKGNETRLSVRAKCGKRKKPSKAFFNNALCSIHNYAIKTV